MDASNDAEEVETGFHGFLTVDILDTAEGDLKRVYGNPSIIVNSEMHGELLRLTWDEVRELCLALKKVTDIAEFG